MRQQKHCGPRTLLEAYAWRPFSPPTGASLDEQRAFYQSRAEMFAQVAESDPDHRFEALANAGLERERVEKITQEIREAPGRSPQCAGTPDPS
jgi:hypothetical protein